jgi:hypothetical protein
MIFVVEEVALNGGLHYAVLVYLMVTLNKNSGMDVSLLD